MKKYYWSIVAPTCGVTIFFKKLQILTILAWANFALQIINNKITVKCVTYNSKVSDKRDIVIIIYCNITEMTRTKSVTGSPQRSRRVILVPRFSEKTLKERNGRWRKSITDSLETRIRPLLLSSCVMILESSTHTCNMIIFPSYI